MTTPPEPLKFRLDLPRYDQDWHTAKRPRINAKTGKVTFPRKRPVWDPLRGNARSAHWAQRHNAVRTVIADVTALATAHKVPACQHLEVRLVWAPGRKLHADVDNLVMFMKVCCDALARGRKDLPGLHLVPDDTPKWMTKHMPVILPPPDNGLWLEVTAHRDQVANAA